MPTCVFADTVWTVSSQRITCEISSRGGLLAELAFYILGRKEAVATSSFLSSSPSKPDSKAVRLLVYDYTGGKGRVFYAAPDTL